MSTSPFDLSLASMILWAIATLAGVSLIVTEFRSGFSAIWRDCSSDRRSVTTCLVSPLLRKNVRMTWSSYS